MITLREPAWAKLNLALDVGARRPDGYHKMRMLMQTVSLCDTVTLHLDSGRWWADANVELPHDETNLALRAARRYCDVSGVTPDGIEIILEKHIPTCGGMAGGSADAAAVLRALQRHYDAPLDRDALLDLALEIGSDVPYCLVGGTALAEGRGERLTVLEPLPACEIVLCRPDFASSTPVLFRALDSDPPAVRPDFQRLLANIHDLATFGNEMWNVFEPVLMKQHPELASIRETLLACGAVGAMLTGTGSVMFGLFTDPAAADVAEKTLASKLPWVARAKPIQQV